MRVFNPNLDDGSVLRITLLAFAGMMHLIDTNEAEDRNESGKLARLTIMMLGDIIARGIGYPTLPPFLRQAVDTLASMEAPPSCTALREAMRYYQTGEE